MEGRIVEFYQYKDSLPLFRQMFPGATRDQMYEFGLRACTQSSSGKLAHTQGTWEKNWVDSKRPFYRVWPKIIPMLTKLDISCVPSSCIRLPDGLDQLHVQLPHGNGLADNGKDLEGICIGHVPTSAGSGVLVMSDDCTIDKPSGTPIYDMWCFGHSDKPLVQVLDGLKLENPMQATTSLRSTVMSLVATLCLIGQDKELVSRLLLSKDASKAIDEESLQRLADKAKRRGRYGWDVGRTIEVTPHVRRPHPALVWTGKGRKIPKIIMRSSAIVHRNKIERIPTGYDN